MATLNNEGQITTRNAEYNRVGNNLARFGQTVAHNVESGQVGNNLAESGQTGENNAHHAHVQSVQIAMHSARQCQAQRVITEYQAVEYEDLGLGRGVDATNPKPWVNKGDFQVRRVVNYDIIGTEEGNLYEGFVNKVESIQNFQSSLSASVPVDKLVSLGIDSELSRIHSVGRISIGRKVLTRTISFQANFTQSSDEDNFESCLSNWIVQQRKVKQEEKEFLGKQGDPDIKTEPDERKVKIKAKEKEEEVGAKECFRIIYETPVSLTSGDESCAKLILLLNGDPENMSGSIECKPTVKSHNENNKFMLFRLLKSAKEASAHSTPATSDEGPDHDTMGPFLIKNTAVCWIDRKRHDGHDDYSVYLKVKSRPDSNDTDGGPIVMDVVATKWWDQASRFYIQHDSGNRNYFKIHYNENPDSKDQSKRLYLSTTKSDGKRRPLQVRSDANEGWSYLSIYDKNLKPAAKDLATEWHKGYEELCINCYGQPRPAPTDSAMYIAICMPKSMEEEDVSIHCEPPVKTREFMLFRLEQTFTRDNNAKPTNLAIEARGKKTASVGSHTDDKAPTKSHDHQVASANQVDGSCIDDKAQPLQTKSLDHVYE